jgi:hypothetical protein
MTLSRIDLAQNDLIISTMQTSVKISSAMRH